MLAGLPKVPSENDPVSNPKRVQGRRAYILRRIRDLECIITQTQFQTASKFVDRGPSATEYEVAGTDDSSSPCS